MDKTRIQRLAIALGKQFAHKKNKVTYRDHLVPSDYDMFDRIFASIKLEEQDPKVYYVEHFALKPGWKPNGKVLQTASNGDVKRTRLTKSTLPSLVRTRKV